jgi:hypothetical protein
MNNGAQPAASSTPQQPAPARRQHGRKTDTLLTGALAPAVEMKAGQYPATLIKWSDETFFLPSKFATRGVQEKMEAYFAVRNMNPEAEGAIRVMRIMVTPPGKLGIHPKSGIYKVLKPLGDGDDEIWDGKRDNVKAGATLNSFLGKTGFVTLEESSKNGFMNITAVGAAPVGITVSYPSIDEGLQALSEQDTVEGAAEDAAEGHIPF